VTPAAEPHWRQAQRFVRQADAREILEYRDEVLAFCREIVQGE
jgi:hypothetical protein